MLLSSTVSWGYGYERPELLGPFVTVVPNNRVSLATVTVYTNILNMLATFLIITTKSLMLPTAVEAISQHFKTPLLCQQHV